MRGTRFASVLDQPFHTEGDAMKSWIRPTAALLAVSLALPACSSMNKTQRGAVIGAAAGGAVGAVVGGKLGSTAKGAIIGAAVGGVTGAAIGRQMDKQAEELAMDIDGARVERVGEGIAVTFDSGLLFDYDSDEIKGAARENLQNLAASLKKYPKTDLLIVGHTDATGTDSYNQGLSQRRANAAKNYLVSQGVASTRVNISGRGESEPIDSNDTADGRAQNRRVEVAIFAGEEMRKSGS
jgi:outer membrane protein OmpA-like peptidoglycan-associated protein